MVARQAVKDTSWKTVRFFVLLLVLVAAIFFYTSTAHGVTEANTCGVTTGTSVFQCSATSTSDNITKMVLEVSNAVFAGVGALCVIGISLGGIIYATAGGDTSKTKQGIGYIVNAAIGLALFLFSFVLLNFLVPGGFFNNAGFDTSGVSSSQGGGSGNNPTSPGVSGAPEDSVVVPGYGRY